MAYTRVRFTVVSAMLQGHEVELDLVEPITVGRTWDNRLALDHKSVSRRHARLEANGDSLRLIDLDSHNGTNVNDELVTERELQPGDVLGFGEVLVRFELIGEAGEGAGPAPGAGEGAAPAADLPAIIPAEGPGAGAVARPLAIEDVFEQAAPTQTIPTATAASRRLRGTLLYGVLLVAVCVLGGVAIWRVGYRAPKPAMIPVQLKVGAILPVNIGTRLDPSRRKYLRGLRRVESIGEPDDERVAAAKMTKFRTFVVVRGRSEGTTDIVLYGPPLGKLILRVLVRGTKPPPAPAPGSSKERRAEADKLYTRAVQAELGARASEKTTRALAWLRRAAALIEDGGLDPDLYVKTSQLASKLRGGRDQRFDELARLIDTRSQEGNLKAAVEAAEELVRIYIDPEEAEYHIVRAFHEDLVEQLAREEQKVWE